jgi:hypothetical protein
MTRHRPPRRRGCELARRRVALTTDLVLWAYVGMLVVVVGVVVRRSVADRDGGRAGLPAR